MVPLAWQYYKLRVGNCRRELMRAIPMRSVACTVMFVVADEDESWHTDVLQSIAMVVLLARENEGQIIFQRRNAGHSDLKKVFDEIGMHPCKLARPAGRHSVLPNI